MQKIASKRCLKELSFGLKQWQYFTDKSIKNELRQDKTFISQLAEQFKDTSFLQQMMTGLNQIFAQFKFTSVEECLNSTSVKLFLSNIAEQVLDSLNMKH